MAQEAVGAIFMSMETGRMMLNLRSKNVTYSYYWGFIGGKVEKDESIKEALLREITEEIGDNIPELLDVIQIDEYNTANKRFAYHSFVVMVPEEFIPRLNDESSGYVWVDPRHWPKPLHPGAKTTLYNNDVMDKIQEMWETKKAL